MAGGKMYKQPKRPKKAVSKAVKSYVHKAIDASVEDKMKVRKLTDDFASIGNASWIEFSTCEPAQGDGFEQRTGVRIKIKSIEIKGVMAQGSSATALDDPYNVVRMVLGLYHGGAGSTSTPLNDGSAVIDYPIMTQYLSDGRLIKKYIDQYIALNITSTEKGEGDGYTPQVKTFNYYKKFKKPITVFFGTSGTTTGDKKLILSMISDSGAIPNPGFVNGWIKVMFEDA